MSRLRSKLLIPPNRWFYIQDGTKLDGGTYEGTVDLIRKYREANNLPAGDPEADLNDFTCERWPNGCMKSLSEPTPSQTAFHEQVGDFLGNYGRWAKTGYETVDQIEANHRANICWKCPANKQVKVEERIGCCGGRKVLQKLASVSKSMASALTWPALRNKSTPADKELYTCEVCGCPSKVSVWLPARVYRYDAAMMHKFREANGRCWKLSTGP